MDGNSVFDDQHKKDLEVKLVRKILDAYDSNELDYYEMKDAAGYILDNFPQVSSHEQLVDFLKNLSGYWPTFKTFLTVELGETKQDNEKQLISKLEEYIKNFPTT